jgi:hypothetical protein
MQHNFIKDADQHKGKFVEYVQKMKSIIKNKEIITTNDIGKMSGGTTNTAPSTVVAAG